jgi:hypothetical protein
MTARGGGTEYDIALSSTSHDGYTKAVDSGQITTNRHKRMQPNTSHLDRVIGNIGNDHHGNITQEQARGIHHARIGWRLG